MKTFITTLAAVAVFATPVMAEPYTINGSEPDDSTTQALIEYALDLYNLQDGDTIEYVEPGKEPISFQYAEGGELVAVDTTDYMLDYTGGSDGDFRGKGYRDKKAMDYNSALASSAEIFHSNGLTGKGFTIYNSDRSLHQGKKNYSYEVLVRGDSIAPGANFIDGTNGDVTLTKNGFANDGSISLPVVGSNKAHSRVWATMEMAKASLIWQKMGAHDANTVSTWIDENARWDYAMGDDFDPNGHIANGVNDVYHPIDLGKAITAFTLVLQ